MRALPGSLRVHNLFFLLLALYLLAGVWLVFRVPAFAMPNENLHYEYVALLRRTGRLPDPGGQARADERHQPPLYYGLAALASVALPPPVLDTKLEPNPFYQSTVDGNRNPFLRAGPATVPTLYLGRLLSLLLGAIGLVATYGFAQLVVSRQTALLIAALTAFQPTYLFLSASLSNDLAVTAASACLLAWTTLIVVKGKGPRSYFVWGILFALAMLTKANAVFLVFTLPVALLAQWRARGRFGPIVTSFMAASATFAPIYGLWLVVNARRQLDVLGVASSLPLGAVLRQPLAAYREIAPYLFRLWKSFWLDWSAGDIGYAADNVYLAVALFVLVALFGWFRSARSARQWGPLLWMHLLWALPLAGAFLAVKTLMVRQVGYLVPEGRWLLPLVPTLAWLAGTGYSFWWPEQRRNGALLSATLAVVATTIFLLVLLIPRFFPLPGSFPPGRSLPADASPAEIAYGDEIALVALEAPRRLTIGRATPVSLYWQPLTELDADYVLALQLVVPGPDGWLVLDTVHTHPGGGLAPTGDWNTGEIIRDTVTLLPEGQVNGPVSAFIQPLLLEEGQPLAMRSAEGPLEVAVAREVVVVPGSAPSPPPSTTLKPAVSFGGLVELVGISAQPAAGGMELTLWWRALAESDTAYTVFVHLLDEEGNLIGQADGVPNRGRSPTTIWLREDLIRDGHRLPEASPAALVAVGLYDPITLDRLAARRGTVPLRDDAYRFNLSDHLPAQFQE